MADKCLASTQPSTVGGERSLPVTLRPPNVTNPIVADRKVALQSGISGIGTGKRLANLEPGTVGDKRSPEITLRPQYLTNLVVAH